MATTNTSSRLNPGLMEPEGGLPPPEPLTDLRPGAADRFRSPPPPGEAACLALWDHYDMLDNVRAHSRLVARVAVAVAERARKTDRPAGMPDHVERVRAAALLHDIAKSYTLRHGGNHSQLGAGWAMEATGDPVIAQAVLHHVYWPWETDVVRYFIPLVIIYADKRVRHDAIVTLDERFDDLVERYGKTQHIRDRIQVSHQQALDIEEGLNTLLASDLASDLAPGPTGQDLG